ncbi:uncharacterized protein DUF2487 [Paenibacillus taihuensis]|uniref:Uncharacterized protein DUF2487 n=1 Tax=Paenibacillus taihuensis TaxID=1156355 RepID=A0A3D9SEE9_9BACL|nr:DUF2487 family protein [Paenibacillus taihuensis]REE94298.1 uncharacterized protein DUF2487 [Paenibacillus taihuensis]
MKFSELSADGWAELAPYLDTAVLPVSGLQGTEMPHEATAVLERLRDVLDLIEIPFKGRIVTYPACQYGTWTPELSSQLQSLSSNLRQVGFKYVVIVMAFGAPSEAKVETGADLIISLSEQGELPSGTDVNDAVRQLWLGRA